MTLTNIFHTHLLLSLPLIIFIGNTNKNSLINSIINTIDFTNSLVFSIDSSLILNPTYYDTTYNSNLLKCLDSDTKTIIIFDNVDINSYDLIVNPNFLVIIFMENSVNIEKPLYSQNMYIFIDKRLDICDLAKLYKLYFGYVYSDFLEFYGDNNSLIKNELLIIGMVYDTYKLYKYNTNSKNIDWDVINKMNIEGEILNNITLINKLIDRNNELNKILDGIPKNNKKVETFFFSRDL